MHRADFLLVGRPRPGRWLWAALGLVVLLAAPSRGDGPVSPTDGRLAERNARAWESLRLREAGKTGEAVAAAEAMLTIERGLFGTNDEDLAGALEFVAGAHMGDADFEGAQARQREALAIRELALGKGHWSTIDSKYALDRLGRLTELDGPKRARYREGTRLLHAANRLGNRSYEVPQLMAKTKEAVSILKEALGESHPEYATYLEQLGWASRIQSTSEKTSPSYRDMVSAFRQSLEIRRKALGEDHPDVARSLDSLSDHPSEGDGPEFTETLLRKSLEVRRKALGEGHPDLSRTLIRLADQIDRSGGDRGEAVALAERAMAIVTAAKGDDDPSCLQILQVLTRLARGMKDEVREERTILRRIELQQRRIRDNRFAFSNTWIGRLGTPPDTGALRFARRWSEFALRETLASSLGELARFHGERGNAGRAGQFMREAMDVYAENLDRQAAVAQEKVHYDPFSAGSYVLALDRFLTLSLEPGAEIGPDEAYRQVLSWKGGYFAYELRARRWRDHPDVAELSEELRRASDELAQAALAAPAPEDRAAWDRIIERLGRRDFLEGELAERVSRIASEERRERPDVDRLKRALPDDVALVDFKVYTPWKGWGDEPLRGGPSLMAFVVRSNGPVERLDLGPWLPLGDAIQEWRRHALPPSDAKEAAIPEPSRQAMASAALKIIDRQIWRPIKPHLEGAGTLLVAPDQALGKFPFSVLPGKERGSFLIEDLAIAVAPVPQLLLSDGGTPGPATPPRLLAVGDVDFDAETGSGPAEANPVRRDSKVATLVPRARMMKFDPLLATGREVDAVRSRFREAFLEGTAVTLRGREATEDAFRKALAGSRYVHLATHGFFEPPELAPRAAGPQDEMSYWSSPQGLVRLSPGLLSGVAFAGANRPPATDRDDGILTAVEAQQLDLDGVELVVLSACDTALGSEARGEGLMGLQRALQVAGARSLVSSLWSVDDAATTALMEEFYAKLWRKRLSRLEALRQAQLAVLRRFDPDKGSFLKVDVPARRLHPYFWAAFTLSGDWR